MLNLTRRHDWPEALAGFIEARRRMPFHWGSNDCALFAADGVLEITGVDLAAEWRGYKTERGALNRIRKAGGMRGFAAELPMRHPGLARRGDIVLVELAGRDTFGIVGAPGIWCGPGAEGLLFRPVSEASIAFAI